MGTFGLRPSAFSSPSESDDESNTSDERTTLAEKEINTTELFNRIEQLQIGARKTETAPNVPSTSDSRASLAGAANPTVTSSNQPSQLQISPVDHSGSSSSSWHQARADLEANHGSFISNPSEIRRSSTRTSLIASFSQSSSSGTNHTSIEYRSETTFTSWSCVNHSETTPQNGREESGSTFPRIEEVEEIGQGGPSSDDDDDYEPRVQRRGARRADPPNDHYAMGYKGVSCVVGGNTVKMFDDETSGGGKLKLLSKVSGLSTPDGKRALSLAKLMLHRQDSNLIMQDKYSRNLLYNFDMQRGKVVDEWKISAEPLVDFCPSQKFNQMLPEATFVGASSSSLYIIDPRLHGYKGVARQTYKPSTRTKFSCLVTTEYGWTAVGSYTGDIRLYDSFDKIAKTHLRGCSGPVLALDVSKDGAYLVATHEKYLVLFDCQMGFSKSIANSVNGSGIRVNLDLEHSKYLQREGVPLVYKSAKFNLGPNTKEKFIVTWIGPYLVAFKLRSILANKPEYEIKRYEDDVVADNFRWNNDQDIFVMTEKKVFVQKRAELSRPRRQSLDLYPSRTTARGRSSV